MRRAKVLAYGEAVLRSWARSDVVSIARGAHSEGEVLLGSLGAGSSAGTIMEPTSPKFPRKILATHE